MLLHITRKDIRDKGSNGNDVCCTMVLLLVAWFNFVKMSTAAHKDIDGVLVAIHNHLEEQNR